MSDLYGNIMMSSADSLRINTLRLEQNNCNFVNNICKGTSVSEKYCISVQTSLMFIPKEQ